VTVPNTAMVVSGTSTERAKRKTLDLVMTFTGRDRRKIRSLFLPLLVFIQVPIAALHYNPGVRPTACSSSAQESR
jgi:hypothetical protein